MTNRYSDLVKKMVDSYQKNGGINHIDGVNLPSKEAIADITNDLLRLIFPGFIGNEVIHSNDVVSHINELLHSVGQRLEGEIAKSLEYKPVSDSADRPARKEHARHLTAEYLNALPNIRELLQSDVEAAFSGDPAAMSHEEIILAYPGLEAIAVQRLAHELYKKSIALIPRIMTEWAHSRTGVDIHPGAEIGPFFFIDHGTGTVIGETCTIGHHVKIYHGVTLGARSTAAGQGLRGKKRHPTIEDFVTIYPGAAIFGGDTVIGENAVIGANAFLMESIPPFHVVTQEDGRQIIKQRQSKPPANSVSYDI